MPSQSGSFSRLISHPSEMTVVILNMEAAATGQDMGSKLGLILANPLSLRGDLCILLTLMILHLIINTWISAKFLIGHIKWCLITEISLITEKYITDNKSNSEGLNLSDDHIWLLYTLQVSVLFLYRTQIWVISVHVDTLAPNGARQSTGTQADWNEDFVARSRYLRQG